MNTELFALLLRRGWPHCLAALLSLSLLLPVSGTAQPGGTGAIEGRIRNAASGAYLGKARVTVKGTGQEVLTDENGRFRLPLVPAGPVELTVAYTGFESQVVATAVRAGETAQVDAGLALSGMRDAGEVVQLAAFTVEDRELSAQGNALNEQKTAVNIKNVVTMEEFGDLGITNPGHFLTYVPGISNVYNTTGEVEGIGVRGMPSSGTLVMYDGVPAATNDPASRAFNFSGTSTANLDRIEVTKVPTPDLPANAVGGSINMISKSGFNRGRAELRYNLFSTVQAKGSLDGWPGGLGKSAGPDGKTSISPYQPGFELNYSLPVRDTVAFTFNLGHNARLQDREYYSPTWDRVRFVQTQGTMNSVLNIFTKDVAALGADWKLGQSILRLRLDATLQDAYTRQNVFTYNFGTGATGGADTTQGAATGVGSVGQTIGQSINQYRRLLNARLGQTYRGDLWRFDWTASYSEARRLFSDVDEGLFGGLNATLPNVIVSARGLSGIDSMTLPQFSVTSRTGTALDPFNPRQYTLNTASSGRMYFKNEVLQAGASAERRFDTRWPLTLKAGGAIERTLRDNWTESLSWNIRPPAAAGGQSAGAYDLIATGYSERRRFEGGPQIDWLSLSKLYDLYRQHPDYFQLNEPAAHTNRVNSSKKIEETISAAYLRADLKAFDNRLWLVAGVRFERTEDEGSGPLNDIRATYRRDAAGNLILVDNRPVQITTDPLALARLQFRERAAYSTKSYQDFYPSVNASYTLADTFVLRAAYAGTIGRPDLNLITPGTSISDPSSATRTVTVVNTGLEPWTADNYDVTLESYEFKGATVGVSGFRKELSGFFVSTRVPLTAALASQFGLPAELLTSDYEVISQENSTADATITGYELSWRQSLRPFRQLPGWVRSLGFFANTTRLHLSGPGANNFSGYSTQINNYGLNYARGNFALKVNFANSNGPRNAVVAANATTPAGTYTGLADRTLVGGSIEYRFHRRFTVHLSGQNLSNELYRSHTFAPGAPAYTLPTQYRDNGIEFVLGLRGEF